MVPKEETQEADWGDTWGVGAEWPWGGMAQIPVDPDEESLLRAFELTIDSLVWSRDSQLFRRSTPAGDLQQLPLLALPTLTSTKVLLFHGPPPPCLQILRWPSAYLWGTNLLRTASSDGKLTYSCTAH